MRFEERGEGDVEVYIGGEGRHGGPLWTHKR